MPRCTPIWVERPQFDDESENLNRDLQNTIARGSPLSLFRTE